MKLMLALACAAMLLGCTMLIDALHLPKKWHVATTIDKYSMPVTIWDKNFAEIPDYKSLERRIDAWVAGPNGSADAIRGWEIRVVRFPFWCGRRTSTASGYCNGITDYQRKTITLGAQFQALEHELDHVTMGPYYGRGHEDAGPS